MWFESPEGALLFNSCNSSNNYTNNAISAFRLDQFSGAPCSHSVAINASRIFWQFSQMSCTIIYKPIGIQKLRLNILGVLVTATSVPLT